MDKCPHCGSDWGVYVTFTSRQYYDFNGDPAGYDFQESEEKNTKFARCRKCDRRISFKRLEESKYEDSY